MLVFTISHAVVSTFLREVFFSWFWAICCSAVQCIWSSYQKCSDKWHYLQVWSKYSICIGDQNDLHWVQFIENAVQSRSKDWTVRFCSGEAPGAMCQISICTWAGHSERVSNSGQIGVKIKSQTNLCTRTSVSVSWKHFDSANAEAAIYPRKWSVR